MFKLLGFLLGSAASIIAIVLLLGIPEFHLTKPTDASWRYDAAVEKLKEKQPAVEHRENVDTTGIEEPPQVTEAEASVSYEDVVDEPLVAEDDVPQQMIDEPHYEEPVPMQDLPDAPGIATDASWYAFWNPFRSEIAARGFVAQLEKVTGLDYRIVKVKAGVYQVAFAYADDQERQVRLSQIQAATGLDLSGT